MNTEGLFVSSQGPSCSSIWLLQLLLLLLLAMLSAVQPQAKSMQAAAEAALRAADMSLLPLRGLCCSRC